MARLTRLLAGMVIPCGLALVSPVLPASGGQLNGGSAGGGGGTGGLPLGCEELGTPGRTGRQCDPTLEGNGTHDQQEPDDPVPPEAEVPETGMLTKSRTHQSTLYGYGFSYRIYQPPQYQPGKPAALMIFQDGGNYTGNFLVPRVIDSLIASGEMPVTIAVFIEPGQHRSEEYDTRSDKYGSMLLHELLPNAVLNTYDIVDDPNGWAIGGHSSGGACAFNVGWLFTDKFRKIMTHSGSFINLNYPTNADYIDMVLTKPKKPLRVNLLSGTHDMECCGDSWFNANNTIAANLDTAGYVYRYMKSTTTHDPKPWATADFPDAMRWLWRGYTLPHYASP
jgi:gluconolactonase